MEFVRDFAGITKDDAAIAGGKGASLGEMARAGLPVPPGFVVLAAAYDLFIREGRMPQAAAAEIFAAFKNLGAGLVAVRSSATAEDSQDAAWAGQLETYLNTTEVDLLTNVQRCWESISSARAEFYRAEKGMADKKIAVAVVVQQMIPSEAAGIVFSVHPVTQDRNQMIIEAAPGLGEAIVSGRVTPDGYIVTKEPRAITDRNLVGLAQVLSDEQILELARLVMKIEAHYAFPCDIEWAWVAGQFYILQSRPITTLKQYIDTIACVCLKDGKILSTRSKGKDTYYIPGGKRDGNETDEQALIREVKEEVMVDLIPETIKYYGTFEAQAHGKPEGTMVRMACYTSEFKGEVKPGSEKEEVIWMGYEDKEKSSPVDQLLLDDLKSKELI